MSVTDGSSAAVPSTAGPACEPQHISKPDEAIAGRLDDVERDHDVRVLFAVEAGSRAWGFASPDSDYDVRFISVRPVPGYLRLDKVRDTIDDERDPVFDLTGWDLTKALRLAHVSNPSLIEWLGSPVVYRTTPAWEALRPLLDRCYQPWPTRHHYLGIAIKNWSNYFASHEVRLKRYFYIIRPLLACRWIAGHTAPPPVPLRQLADTTLEPSMREPLADLFAATQGRASDAPSAPRLPEWDTWILHEFATQQTLTRADPVTEGPSWDELNRAFTATLGLSSWANR